MVYLSQYRVSRNPLLITIFLVFISFGSLMFWIQTLIFIGNVYNKDVLPKGTISQFLLLISFFCIFLAYFSTFPLDKNNWPQEKGTIENSSISRNVFSNSISMLLTINYSFVYKSKKYAKVCTNKITFQSEKEAKYFSEKFTKDKFRFINVYIFKLYPKFSSETERVNIFYLAIYYFIGFSFIFYYIAGFFLHLIDLKIAKIVPTYSIDGISTGSTIVFQNSLFKLVPVFDIFTFLITILVLVLLLLFSYKIIVILKHNKIFISIPSISSDYIQAISKADLSGEITCSKCDYTNESSSLFCFNCGKNLWN